MSEFYANSLEKYDFMARINAADTEEKVLDLFRESLHIMKVMKESRVEGGFFDEEQDWPEMCRNTLFQEAKVLTPRVLLAFREHSHTSWTEILLRSDVSEETASFIVEHTWKHLESSSTHDKGTRSAERGNSFEIFQWAFNKGLVPQDADTKERLCTLVNDFSTELRTEDDISKSYRTRGVVAGLGKMALKCGEWDSSELVHFLSLNECFDVEDLEEIATHGAANLEVWRAMAAMPDKGNEQIREILAQIPIARKDPEIRKKLKKGGVSMEVLEGLCKDAGEEVREMFASLVRLSTYTARRLLEAPDFNAITHLRREDLLPLLTSERSQDRLVAIAALARIEGVQAPEQPQQEVEQNWRERFVTTSFPF